MKNIKFRILIFLLSPILLYGAGVGISGSYSSMTEDSHNNNKRYNSGGIGFVFDTNLGEDRTFNYRLGLEYMRTSLSDHISNESYEYAKRINVVNTFGFGFYRSQTVRLWAAPRILVSEYTYKKREGETYYDFSNKGIDVGIGPALGININFNRHLTLSIDADYMAIFSSDREIAAIRTYFIFCFDEITPMKQ